MRSCKAICIDLAVTDDCSDIAQRAEVVELANMYPADRYCQDDFAPQYDLAHALALGHLLGRPKQMDSASQCEALIVYHMAAGLLLSTVGPSACCVPKNDIIDGREWQYLSWQ